MTWRSAAGQRYSDSDSDSDSDDTAKYTATAGHIGNLFDAGPSGFGLLGIEVWKSLIHLKSAID